jgi:anti-sigma B factor antagonist
MTEVRVASSQGEVIVYAPEHIAMVGGGAESVKNVIRSLLGAGFLRIVLDLKGTSYIDSSGLGELVLGFTMARNLGGNLRLNRLHGKPRDLLELTKLYSVFHVSNQNVSSLPSIEVQSNDVSPLRAAQALPLLLQLRENRIHVELGIIDDLYKIDIGDRGNGSQLVMAAPHILSTGAGTVLHEILREFEELINSPRVKEEDIHQFLDRNPGLLLGHEYRHFHSKVLLEREDTGPLIPDFILQPFDQELCDLLELKLPSEPLIVGTANRKRFSGAVHAATTQLRTYRDYFEDRAKREGIFSRYGIKAYRPRLSVVIGRAPEIDPIEYRRIAESYMDVKVLTYDDLLKRAKRFLIL